MKTIDFTKNSDTSMDITIAGNPPRTLYNPNNLLVKGLSEGNGAIIKLTDETFRQTVYLDDVVSQGGVQKSPYANVTALVNALNSYFA